MNRIQPPETKRQYLRELVRHKNKWDDPLSHQHKVLGFLGWHERGYLPHCDFPGLVQFATFRLVDSMPACRRGEWQRLLTTKDLRGKRGNLESYLDRGIGECHLRDAGIAKCCEDALLFHHKDRYELLAWCVMPNHVHVLVHIWEMPLSKIVQSWKKFVARRAGKAPLFESRTRVRRSNMKPAVTPNWSSALRPFWEREYWDTFMRSETQENAAIRYIEGNPVKANLCREAKDWPFSSAKFRNKHYQLDLPLKPTRPGS